MLITVLAVTPLDGHRLRLRFSDGVEGEVDVRTLVAFDGVFAPLRDEAYFRRVRVDRGLGTIVWPDGADLDPQVLYSAVTGAPLPGRGDRPRA